MRKGDVQLAIPYTEFTATKAVIEAIAAPVEGMIAYASDTHEIGTYGAAWEWQPAAADVVSAVSLKHAAATIGATANGLSITGQEISLAAATAATPGAMSAAYASKLDGIEAGAEVNNISDVNATNLTDGGATTLHTHLAILPSTRLDDFDYDELIKYLSPIHAKNLAVEFAAGTYARGVTAVANAYYGGVYSPTQNRIYLIPRSQANQTNWHYIDCATGTVVAYAHGVTAVAYAYVGGVYSPTQNRIYLVPRAQSNQTNWHYIAEFSQAEISPSLMASALFNKF